MAESVTLLAPFAGRVVPLSDLSDPVFAQGIMGGGIAIDPVQADQILALAPCPPGKIFATLPAHGAR
ncbi:MAG: PTS glucose transporter subunit IIA, partial [Chloroflexota bacterium]